MANSPQDKRSHDGGMPGCFGASPLFARMYETVKEIAARQVARLHPSDTLQTTVLVNEAFLKMQRDDKARFASEGEFYVAVARVMRNIIVDYYRMRQRQKRGGGLRRVELHESAIPDESEVSVLELDEALQQLAQQKDQNGDRKARVIECRFFAGMSTAETAKALGISEAKVERDWAYAKTFLRGELRK